MNAMTVNLVEIKGQQRKVWTESTLKKKQAVTEYF